MFLPETPTLILNFYTMILSMAKYIGEGFCKFLLVREWEHFVEMLNTEIAMSMQVYKEQSILIKLVSPDNFLPYCVKCMCRCTETMRNYRNLILKTYCIFV